MSFSDDPRKIKLSDFSFRPNERFIYEYDFTGNWQYQIRLEEVRPLDPWQFYSTCVAGKQLALPEDIGGPWGFMKARDHYCKWYILSRFADILKKNASRKYREEFEMLSYWSLVDSMSRKGINDNLKDLFIQRN